MLKTILKVKHHTSSSEVFVQNSLDDLYTLKVGLYTFLKLTLIMPRFIFLVEIDQLYHYKLFSSIEN